MKTLLAGLASYPLDWMALNMVPSVEFHGIKMICATDEVRARYEKLFQGVSELLQQFGVTRNLKLRFLRGLMLDERRLFMGFQPYSRVLLIPCLPISQFSFEKQKHYTCFLLIFAETAGLLLKKHPCAFVARKNRATDSLMRRDNGRTISFLKYFRSAAPGHSACLIFIFIYLQNTR